MIEKIRVRDIDTDSIHEVVSIDFDKKKVVMESEECGRTTNTFDRVELIDDQLNMSIIGELEKQLTSWRNRSICLGRINCIVMHPISWKLLCAAVDIWGLGQIKQDCIVGDKLIYRGITVLRSTDVVEYEFKIY